MSAIKETVKLICCEAGVNSNKFWTGVLYENGDVECKWGRVGKKHQSKFFPGKGEAYLRKKEAEKRKGKVRNGQRVYYTDLKTVGDEVGSASTTTISSSGAAAAARRDIKTGNARLDRLVDRLIKSNIHNITASTTITYNSATGLFSTPLGIVTLDAIEDARLILANIKRDFDNKTRLKRHVSDYLRLIPHDIGMKFRVESIFPDDDASIQKELGVLDSLKASYDALQTQAPDKGQTVQDKVFDVELDIVKPTDPEFKRIADKLQKSKKDMHGYGHVRIANAYRVQVGFMDQRYDRKVGNDTEVYHGTSEANLLSILKSGLNVAPPSSAYIAGKMFGNGIYGTETSTKAMGYTFGRWGGRTSGNVGWIFICDFAMGKPHYPSGYQNGRYTPPRGHDSCWALPSKTQLYNDELIVYRNQQVNIRYLLELR